MAVTRQDFTIAAAATVLVCLLTILSYPPLQYVFYAFAAGVLVTVVVSGLFLLVSPTAEVTKGSELGAIQSQPPYVAFTLPESWQVRVAAWTERSQYSRKTVYPSSSTISEELDALLDLILQDSVKSWYVNISQNTNFVQEVDKAIRGAVSSLLDRLIAVDIVEICVSRMIPVVTAHLRDFYDAERAVRGKNLTRVVTESEELDLAIAGRYRDGILHPATSLSYSDPKSLQQQYLRELVEKLLPEILPQSQIKSRAVATLTRELVACAVLSPLMQMLSDPDSWNQIIEAYGRTMLQDRNTVRKLRAALDEHASPPPKSTPGLMFPRLAAHDSERQFERFVRSIRRCNNLSDARRFRSEISSQLKRESKVEGQDTVYIRRLNAGKHLLDQTVVALATGGSLRNGIGQPTEQRSLKSSRLDNATLSDILHDTAGLSYFMEYMDRQRLMPLVQFWIVVDGFRNPLEGDVPEAEEDFPSAAPSWTDADRLDLAQINEAYMARPELNVSDSAREAVRQFLKAGTGATSSQYQKARQAILRAQSKALQEMELNHLPKFKESDLFYKYLTSDETSVLSRSAPSPVAHKPIPRVSTRMPVLPHAQSSGPPSPSPSSSRKGTLRRAIASSGDLKAVPSSLLDSTLPRRSLDSQPQESLFGDDDEDDFLSKSRQSIDTDPNAGISQDAPAPQMVEAMEVALTHILEEDATNERPKPPPTASEDPLHAFTKDNDSGRSSFDLFRAEYNDQRELEKPSIASLGLIDVSSRSGVFSDDDLFPAEQHFLEDEHEDPEDDISRKGEEDDIHEAAPGDLGLAEAIATLTMDIERLNAQHAVVESLTMKAELTNNTAELRILRKSKSSLQREIRRKELQRRQYVIQERDNSLYGRSTVRIKSVRVGTEADGREYALYIVEVQRNAGEQMPAASWVIARRYSEFHDLHQRLRIKYPSVRNLDFPGRRMVMKLQKDFLKKRRQALEKYLRELLLLPDVTRSRDVRAFLSQQAIATVDHEIASPSERRDFITRFYNSVTDGMDDILGNIPVLDQLSVAGQNLISAATNQLSTMPPTILEDPSNTAEAEAELNAFEDRELEPFVKPICDIFLEVFELNRGNNWLRGRAVVVVLHQLLGGTIERRVRENAKALVQEDFVRRNLRNLRELLWPGGVKREPPPARTASERSKSRTEASLTLATLVPDIAGNVVGRANAQAASRRIFATFNNPRLNSHLAFTILDEVVDVLFEKPRPVTESG